MQRNPALLFSVGAVLVAGLVGASAGPQHPRAAIWYDSLEKPAVTPPGPAIGAVWTVLEALLCFAGYRLLTAAPRRRRQWALAGWTATLAGLAGFPQAFFGARQLGSSTAVAAAMCAAAATSAAAAYRVDRDAAAALAPLVAWTAFATLLSEELWRRNR